MIEILVDNLYQGQVDEHALTMAALGVLAHQERPHDSEISIRVTGDEVITKLNLEYRGEDRATDVLSFPVDETNPESGQVYLGDICISLPKVKSQAKRFGHNVVDELQLLVVHGCLHLLGYDHHDEAEKEIMWQIQAEIMDALGVKINADDLS